MLDRFGKSGDPTTLERTAKICALADEPTVPIAELRRLAQQAIERAAKDTSLLPWYHLALGLVEYRAGDFEAANKALARCSGDENPLSLLPATARIVAAMATAKSGKMDDARRQWEEARALGRRVPAVNSESVGRSWHDVLVHHLLTREAEELFEKKVEKD
jgi:hypothetical protein